MWWCFSGLYMGLGREDTIGLQGHSQTWEDSSSTLAGLVEQIQLLFRCPALEFRAVFWRVAQTQLGSSAPLWGWLESCTEVAGHVCYYSLPELVYPNEKRKALTLQSCVCGQMSGFPNSWVTCAYSCRKIFPAISQKLICKPLSWQSPTLPGLAELSQPSSLPCLGHRWCWTTCTVPSGGWCDTLSWSMLSLLCIP